MTSAVVLPKSGSADAPKQRQLPKWVILVTVLALVLAVCLPTVVRYHSRMALIRKVEQSGGEVLVARSRSKWLREIVGDEWLRGFGDVISVDAYRSPLSEDDVKQIAGMPSLRWLAVGPSITDDGLRHVSGLSNLETLVLGGSGITDDGLKHISGLSKLEVLGLYGLPITDAGVKHTLGLPRLRSLELDATQITDECLESLSHSSGLKVLTMHETRVTSEGVTELKKRLPDCEIRH